MGVGASFRQQRHAAMVRKISALSLAPPARAGLQATGTA